jgi:hypothetical protein
MRHFVLVMVGMFTTGSAALGQMPAYYYPCPQLVLFQPVPPYYAAPIYAVRPVYFAAPIADASAPYPLASLPTGEKLAYGGVLTTDGVIPVQDYFTGLQRRSSYLREMRERQSPGRVLPPVLPPKIDEHTARAIAAEPDRPNPISVPLQTAAPVAPPRGFLQRLFAPPLDK